MTEFPTKPSDTFFVEPPGGWKRFVATTWEQQSAYFPNCVASPLIDLDRAFRAIVNAGDAELRRSMEQTLDKQRVRFYLEHAAISRDLSQYLPHATDKSLPGYYDRVTRLLNGRDFTLVVNDVQAYDFELWSRMRAFLSELYSYVGLPVYAEVTLYLSRSRATAVGIHKDPVSNFLFQLTGTKRFRMWPSQFIKSTPDLIRTSAFDSIANEAITVDVKPGDLLYIPSDYFHLAEADQEFSVHLSILIGTDTQAGYIHAVQLFSRTLRRRISAIEFPPFLKLDKNRPNGARLDLPASYESLVEASADLRDDVYSTVVEEFVKLSTALGCELAPPLPEFAGKLLEDDSIALNPQSCVAYHLFKDKLYIASNGHGFSCPAHSLVVELLNDFTTSDIHQVGLLLRTYSGWGTIGNAEAELCQEDARKLLDGLHRIGAIRKVEVSA